MSRRRPTRVTALVTGCIWLAGGTAHAFFPPLPIVPGPVTVIPQPTLPTLPNASDGSITPVPPVPPPPFVPPPAPPVIPQDVPNPPKPQTVPEPASVVSAAIGLGAVIAAARRRRSSPTR